MKSTRWLSSEAANRVCNLQLTYFTANLDQSSMKLCHFTGNVYINISTVCDCFDTFYVPKHRGAPLVL